MLKLHYFFQKKTKMTGRLNWPVEQIEKYHVYEKRCKINNYGKVGTSPRCCTAG